MNTDQMISYGSFFAYFNDTAPFKTGKILKQHQNTTSNINIENYTYESNYKIDNYFVDFYNVMYYTHISLSFVETNSSITNNTDGSKILFNDISNAGNIFVPSLCANSFSGSSFDDL
jgi:hypothetical protein